jgi:SAM-dependent methyltransferase
MTLAPDLEHRLQDAFHGVREPLFRQIIADALEPSRPHARVLDAGCGDAFYSRLLAEHLGPQTHVVALDRDHQGLQDSTPPDAVHICQGDLEHAGFEPHSFDVIWLCRAMHSANDPLRRLRALGGLLRPGGTLVVIENDFGHHPCLAWPPEFERQVLAAHLRYLRERASDGTSLERYFAGRHLPAWLPQSGYRLASLHTYASHDVAPLAPPVEAYWALFLAWLGQRIWPHLSASARRTYESLCDPASPDWMLARPGFCCTEFTTVACGRAAE